MSREREIPTGVEEQNLAAEAVHDEGPEARPHDVRRQVSGGIIVGPLLCDLWSILLTSAVWWKGKG